MPNSTSLHDLSNTRVGNYDVHERLGAGGMAVVYRATQQPLGREVALKALLPSLVDDQGFLQRFELEAKTLARLDHPNILPIYDFVVTPEVSFLTMPLIKRGTLRDILDRGPLDGATAWRYLRQTGEGLQHAHDAGIIHRDLKPNNVLIHNDGRAVLADFGLARSAKSDLQLTAVGFTLGTPGYMAPEQVLGQELDHRVDIYAMGVMTFEMMTGRMPFGGTTAVEIAIATVSQPIPSAAALNRNLPDELDAVLRKAMAKEPKHRPASINELIAMLGAVPQRRAAPSTPRPVPAPQPRPAEPAAASPAIAAWYFDAAMHAAKEAAGPAWLRVAQQANLASPKALEEARDAMTLAVITTAFESTFGPDATQKLKEWGRRTTERALAARPNSANEQKALKLVPGRKRLSLLLKNYTQSLDDMRGQPAHAWREVDPDHYSIAHYRNPYALNRRRAEKSCHFWIASYEAMLRWAGLLNDWLVEEVECGCVTHTDDCVFAIRSTKS